MWKPVLGRRLCVLTEERAFCSGMGLGAWVASWGTVGRRTQFLRQHGYKLGHPERLSSDPLCSRNPELASHRGVTCLKRKAFSHFLVLEGFFRMNRGDISESVNYGKYIA